MWPLTGGRITVSLTALQMGLSTFKVGTLVAVFAVLPMLFSVRAGRWVDRVGVQRPLIIGTALVAVGTALPFISDPGGAADRLLFDWHRLHAAPGRHPGPARPRRTHATAAQLSLMSLALAGSGFPGR